MCGRFGRTTPPEQIIQRYGIQEVRGDFTPSYNIAPSQQAPIVRTDSGHRVLELMKWGLVPSWAKDEKIGYKMINARAESVIEKPSFRSAFRKRRCIVPACGFFE